MAQITFNIPDAVLPRVIDGIAKRYGYKTTLEDGEPNPETKAQFARRKIIEFIKRAVRDAESQAAADAAKTAAETEVENEITIT